MNTTDTRAHPTFDPMTVWEELEGPRLPVDRRPDEAYHREGARLPAPGANEVNRCRPSTGSISGKAE